MTEITEAPRRYGVNHEGFDYDIGRRLVIRCNGEVQEQVVKYDCDQGFVVKYRLDEKGEPMLTPDKQRVASDTVFGTVTAELTP